MRGWMSEGRSYIPPVGIGEVMRAGGIGRVTDSRHPDYEPGELVSGMFGVQRHAVSNGRAVRKVDTSLAPPDQFPLYEYRAAFAQLMNNTFGAGELFKVGTVTAVPHVDGSNATVDVTASGTYPGTDYRTGAPAPQPWQLVNGCVDQCVPAL